MYMYWTIPHVTSTLTGGTREGRTFLKTSFTVPSPNFFVLIGGGRGGRREGYKLCPDDTVAVEWALSALDASF